MSVMQLNDWQLSGDIVSFNWFHHYMVVVDDSCLQADSQPKSGGLVWGSAAAWRCSAIHQMNRVNSRNDLWSWWQHYKYRPGIIIIIIIITLFDSLVTFMFFTLRSVLFLLVKS